MQAWTNLMLFWVCVNQIIYLTLDKRKLIQLFPPPATLGAETKTLVNVIKVKKLPFLPKNDTHTKIPFGGSHKKYLVIIACYYCRGSIPDVLKIGHFN
jgi:hypothetical protein